MDALACSRRVKPQGTIVLSAPCAALFALFHRLSFVFCSFCSLTLKAPYYILGPPITITTACFISVYVVLVLQSLASAPISMSHIFYFYLGVSGTEGPSHGALAGLDCSSFA